MKTRTSTLENRNFHDSILTLILAVTLIISGFSFTAPVFADGEEGEGTALKNYNVQLEDMNGNTVSTSNTSSKFKLIIFGRTGCGNTRSTVKSISGSSWVSDPDYEVMFIEEGAATDEELKEFVDSCCCSDSTVCPAKNYQGTELMWAYVEYFRGDSSSIIYPVIFYVDENNLIREMTTSFKSEYEIIKTCQSFCEIDTSNLYDFKEVKVEAVCGQTDARGMLEEMNARRTGSNGVTPWCWNQDNTEKVAYS
ncbi:MAG: hypothetical protein IJJ06_11255 [Mogibacterium sp.]|nr:hypothetical protein [Mogibacterium sp.]MBR0340852.1 hypothetical protein [Oscillospiraceae bacterium]